MCVLNMNNRYDHDYEMFILSKVRSFEKIRVRWKTGVLKDAVCYQIWHIDKSSYTFVCDFYEGKGTRNNLSKYLPII